MDKNNKKLQALQITGAHGLRGIVKVKSFLPELLVLNEKKIQLFDEQHQVYDIAVLSKSNEHYLASIRGVHDRTAAEKIYNLILYVERRDLPNLSQDEFYCEELVGLNVYLDGGGYVGTVLSIANFGASDLLEILMHETQQSEYHPFNKDFVSSVDFQTQKIIIRAFA